MRITMPSIRRFDEVVIQPAAEGFPVDFEIEVWDGANWHSQFKVRGATTPKQPLKLWWSPGDRTGRLRLRATKLGRYKGGYGLHVGEVDVFREFN